MGLQLDRDGVVEVLQEGRWLPGIRLHVYRRDDGRWRGIVRYTAGVGEQYEQARDQDEIRRPTPDARSLARHLTTGPSPAGDPPVEGRGPVVADWPSAGVRRW